MSTNGHPPSDDENNLSLWKRFTQGIKPLHPHYKKPNPIPPPAKAPIANQSFEMPSPIIPSKQSENPKQKPQLDGRRKAKLKKGKIPVEAVLDLHGMTQDQAHQALTSFLVTAHQTKKRCVLVITGKGARSESGIGVLKSRLPDWLNISPLSNIVLDHALAHRKHGGDGAFYIYLRREAL